MILFLQNIIIGSLLMLAFQVYTNPRRVNIVSNKWLSLLLLMTALIFVSGSGYLFFTSLDNFVLFAISPVLYLTILNFVSPDRRFKRKEWRHFIPFLLFLPIAVFTVFQEIYPPSIAQKTGAKNTVSNDWVGFLLIFSLTFQVFTYLILSYLKLRKHTKNIALFASSVEKIDLKWLQYLLFTIAVMLVIWFSDILFGINALAEYSNVGYFICIYIVAYFSYQQVEIFPYSKNDIENIKEIIDESEQKESTTKQKRFTDEQLTTHKTQILQLMETEKIYLDDELSLPKLASLMSLSPNDLSYLINEGFNENFFQFINKYRVEEAKKLLLSDKYAHLNILGLAFESGFGSKSTFNATFKKMTGLSPSEFQKTFSKSAQN
jgi:AraC-like DNA-binding protein